MRVREAPQKLAGCQGPRFVLTAVLIVFPAECDFAFGKGNQPVIGYGDTVGVVRQIFQYVLRTSKGGFDVDHPVVTMHGTQEGEECFLIGK